MTDFAHCIWTVTGNLQMSMGIRKYIFFLNYHVFNDFLLTKMDAKRLRLRACTNMRVTGVTQCFYLKSL